MLKKQMTQFLEKLLSEKHSSNEVFQLEIFKEEKEYIERRGLLTGEMEAAQVLVEKEPLARFDDVYIERCDKESEELLAEESSSFLDQSIRYFKNHLNEFMYLESKWFDIIGVDAISFEVDSVFGTYDVMLGIKLPKKTEVSIKSFLTSNLKGEEGSTFDLMFNGNDGLWEMNFTLNDIEHFTEDWTIREAHLAIYRFLFMLGQSVEEGIE